MLMLLILSLAFVRGNGSSAKEPSPNLHRGGINPSTIPNDAVTLVTLPGYHLAGAHLKTDPICEVVSYQSTDDEIKIKMKGTRTVDDKDDLCTIEVRTPGGMASTWIVVELTDAQQEEQRSRQYAEDKAKAEAFTNRAGKTWRLSFANGSSDTYTSTGANPDSVPTFQNSAGGEVKLTVSNDNSVTIIEPGCLRTGTLMGTQVKNGQSQGQCTPSGSWTATVVR